MISELLPDGVVAVEAFDDVPDEAPFPGEEDLIAHAVDKRRREFITARRCARKALVQLGVDAVPIRPGPRREPLWPNGVVGSLTHCDGYRAAALALDSTLTTIGIDAEPHGALPEGVLDAVTRPAERRMLTGLRATDPSTHWDRMLFSAKESVYKAWYPLARCWLGFGDAELSIDPAGTFTARILVDGPVGELRGRFLVGHSVIGHGLVVTVVTH